MPERTMPQAPTLPPQASPRAETAVSAAMQGEIPPPADGDAMQAAQQPQAAVDAQVKADAPVDGETKAQGATHAQAHSALAPRELFTPPPLAGARSTHPP